MYRIITIEHIVLRTIVPCTSFRHAADAAAAGSVHIKFCTVKNDTQRTLLLYTPSRIHTINGVEGA